MIVLMASRSAFTSGSFRFSVEERMSISNADDTGGCRSGLDRNRGLNDGVDDFRDFLRDFRNSLSFYGTKVHANEVLAVSIGAEEHSGHDGAVGFERLLERVGRREGLLAIEETGVSTGDFADGHVEGEMLVEFVLEEVEAFFVDFGDIFKGGVELTRTDEIGESNLERAHWRDRCGLESF